MKATKLLAEQHEKVRDALSQLEGGEGDASRLLEDVANDLTAHMAVERQVFYPAVRSVKPDRIDESPVEHAVAEIALKRLLCTLPTDPLFKARVTVLRELVEHHFEEEESALFPAVEKALHGVTLEELGTRLEALFREARARGFEALVPSAPAVMSADEFDRAVPPGPITPAGR